MSYSNGLGNLQHLIGNLATNGSTTAKPTEQPAIGTATSNAVRKGVDAAKLSPASDLVSQAVGGSDVRAEKVAALQKAISNGTYKVSSSDVATSILNSLLS